jgi:hypothetical protein
MCFHWASQTLLKNRDSRYTQPYGTCLCYKVCVQVQGAAYCTHHYVRQCVKCYMPFFILSSGSRWIDPLGIHLEPPEGGARGAPHQTLIGCGGGLPPRREPDGGGSASSCRHQCIAFSPQTQHKHYWCGTHQLVATSRSHRYTCRTPGGTNMHRQHPRADHQIETCTGVKAPGKRKGDYDKNATSLRWGVESPRSSSYIAFKLMQ